jgi:hypothetical protein
MLILRACRVAKFTVLDALRQKFQYDFRVRTSVRQYVEESYGLLNCNTS